MVRVVPPVVVVESSEEEGGGRGEGGEGGQGQEDGQGGEGGGGWMPVTNVFIKQTKMAQLSKTCDHIRPSKTL